MLRLLVLGLRLTISMYQMIQAHHLRKKNMLRLWVFSLVVVIINQKSMYQMIQWLHHKKIMQRLLVCLAQQSHDGAKD